MRRFHGICLIAHAICLTFCWNKFFRSDHCAHLSSHPQAHPLDSDVHIRSVIPFGLRSHHRLLTLFRPPFGNPAPLRDISYLLRRQHACRLVLLLRSIILFALLNNTPGNNFLYNNPILSAIYSRALQGVWEQNGFGIFLDFMETSHGLQDRVWVLVQLK